MMTRMRKVVGRWDRYRRGRVVYLDFTYVDCPIVWVQYKMKCVGYIWEGGRYD